MEQIIIEVKFKTQADRTNKRKPLLKQVVLGSNRHAARLDKQMSANKSQREEDVYAAKEEVNAKAL